MKRVALVVDYPNSVFSRIAHELVTHTKLPIQFEIVSAIGAINKWQRDELVNNYDLVHLFWRMQALSFSKKYKTKLTTCYYDHLLSDATNINQMIRSKVKNVYFSSKKLSDIYASRFGIFGRECEDGVSDVFLHKSSNNEMDKIRVGWVGNSAWGTSDHKGFHSILTPVVKQLEGKGFEFKIIDSNRKIVAFQEMPNYYRSIDVLICTSKSEGTPNPILEASASGCAWISTDVGIVTEFSGVNQRRFIINRNTEDFLRSLMALKEDRSLLGRCKSENYQKATEWTWTRKVEKHDAFFAENLNI